MSDSPNSAPAWGPAPIQFTRLTDQVPTISPAQALPDPGAVVGLVAVDVETSGLHPDDGARISVVSVAWFEDAANFSRRLPQVQIPSRYQEAPSDLRETPTGATETQFVALSAAWPFAQGPDEDALDAGQDAWDRLMQFLEQAGGGLVNHNLRFDLLQLANLAKPGYAGRDLIHRAVADTWVNAQELWPTLPSLALKNLAVWLFGGQADEEKRALQPYLGRKSDPRFDLVPWQVMRPYATADVELVQNLHYVQCRLFAESSLSARFVDLEMRSLRALARMELKGLPYAVEASHQAASTLTTSIDELTERLPFKPTPQGSKDYFFGELGLTPTEFTATGKPSLPASLVDRLATQGVPNAADLATLNRYRSARSKWYVPFADRAGSDGRVRTSFRHVRGTKSGRFSASRINLQAVPADYRLKLPVPTPRQLVAQAVRDLPPTSLGRMGLWELDLAQAELRVAALYSGCTPMLDAIEHDRDVHSETASQLFDATPDHPEWTRFRQLAKRSNFSLIFGAGPRTFHQALVAEGEEMTYRQVQDLVYSWRDLYPQFGSAIESAQEFCETYGFVDGVLARPRYYAPGEDAHSSFNQVVQSSLATYGKLWLADTDAYLASDQVADQLPGGAGLVLVVHDSQDLLLPEDLAPQVLDHVLRSSRRIWDSLFPGVGGGAEAERWA